MANLELAAAWRRDARENYQSDKRLARSATIAAMVMPR
jgi:hypothetical protein